MGLRGGVRRVPVVALVGAFALLATPFAASAQTVGVRAFVTPGATVGVGTPFTLNVEITGTQSLDREPEVPDLGAFAQYLGSNTQTSMQMVNGRTTVSLTVQYRFQALSEGVYSVPSFDVFVGGQTIGTEPIELTVTTAAAGVPQGQQGAVVGPDDLFITAEASKTRVRDGEPLVIEYRIWTRVDVSSFNFTRVPEPEGFWVEDITPAGQPQVEQLTRNGQQYASAVIRRVALVPTGVGERTVEPIVLEAQVRVRGNDPFDRFFGGRSLFDSTVPAGVLSEAVTITVDPLPPGAPDPYSGMVGSLDLAATLDRDSVDANEAVTLTVRVSGDGNVRAIPEPVLELPDDFEVFPPEVSESVRPFGSGLTGEKTFEYVLIPRAPGLRELPSVSMSYLDGGSGVYRVAETGPLALTVSGTPIDAGLELGRGGVAQLRTDIRYIHLGTAALRPLGRPLHGSATFWMVFLLPLVAIAGALGLRRHRDRIEGDVAYARGRRASGVAKKRLAEARRLATAEDPRPFYAEVARALRGLVADRLNVSEAGLQTSDLESLVIGRGVATETVGELRACLEHCDRQRFAPPGSDPEEKNRFLARAGGVMVELDRGLRS